MIHQYSIYRIRSILWPLLNTCFHMCYWYFESNFNNITCKYYVGVFMHNYYVRLFLYRHFYVANSTLSLLDKDLPMTCVYNALRLSPSNSINNVDKPLNMRIYRKSLGCKKCIFTFFNKFIRVCSYFTEFNNNTIYISLIY